MASGLAGTRSGPSLASSARDARRSLASRVFCPGLYESVAVGRRRTKKTSVPGLWYTQSVRASSHQQAVKHWRGNSQGDNVLGVTLNRNKHTATQNATTCKMLAKNHGPTAHLHTRASQKNFHSFVSFVRRLATAACLCWKKSTNTL